MINKRFETSYISDLVIERDELKEQNKRLTEEIEKLKLQNYKMKIQGVYGWEQLKSKIHFELSKLEVKRPYCSCSWRIQEAVSQILRSTFNLQQVKTLKAKDYQKSKELVDVILKFIIDNFE